MFRLFQNPDAPASRPLIRKGQFKNSQGLTRTQREALVMQFFRRNVPRRIAWSIYASVNPHGTEFIGYTEQVLDGSVRMDNDKWLRLLKACVMRYDLRLALLLPPLYFALCYFLVDF